MKLLDLQQGSPEWLAARGQYQCASEAPSVMAASTKLSRSELLRLKATGAEREFSEWVQRNLLDKGHTAEAAIRPYAESIVGEDLFPVVGVEGGFLASFDGLTMAEDTIFEHKLWSEALAAQVRGGSLDAEYYWQLEHQLMVSGAGRALFMVSDGTPERCVHLFYLPVASRREKLIAGWAQFVADLDGYQHVEVIPAAVAAPVEGLPALAVTVNGAIAIASNLDLFGGKLRDFIASIVQKPATDQDFADCEQAVKVLERAEDALKAAEANALAQTASVDELRRTVALYVDLARTNRLSIGKLVTARKEAIRVEIGQEAAAKLTAHIRTLNERLAKVAMPPIQVNFPGVMKGKKTVASCRSAVDDELARAKIEANELAETIGKNLRTVEAAGHAFLFADLQQIAQKTPADFALLVRSRVAEHQAAEERKEAAARERIRSEEAAKAQREADARAEADRQRIRAEEQQKAREEVRTAAAAADEARGSPIATPTPSTRSSIAPVSRALKRPSDEALLHLIASTYAVPKSTAAGWLREIDFDALARAA